MLAHLAVLDPKIWSVLAEAVSSKESWFEERERKIAQERKQA